MFELIALISTIVLTIIFNLLFKKNNLIVSNKSGLLLIKLIILITGFYILCINLNDFNYYQSQKSWSKVKGEITSFEIVGVKTKEPEITYKYQVDNTFYKNKSNLETPLFGSRKYQEQTARTIAGNYKVGDSVTVYYNSHNPNQSVLKIFPGWSTYMQFTFGIFIISVIFALLIPGKRNRNKG